jgi:signal transduction histidine kinase
MLDSFQKTQKELQEYHRRELRSNYKMATIGEMSARLAHEIRNPVTGIANASEILVSNAKDEQSKPILEEIQRQAKRVNNAITDLLKYSRKSDLNLSINNINELIERTVLFLNNQVKNKEVEFRLELQDDLPHFRFDIEQIENVFLNLGLNAIHFINEKGTITFKTVFNPAESRIYANVVDTGQGIPEENLSRVFHPYWPS